MPIIIYREGVWSLEFCPKCGMRMTLRKGEEDTKTPHTLACVKCGHLKPLTTERPRKSQVIKRRPDEEIVIVGEEEAKLSTMPKENRECPRCGNMEAFWWMVQTRGADESTTQFFRCTKCSYTWREMA